MHILISAETKPPLDQAKQLSESLLSHVRQEYYQYVQQKTATQYYGYVSTLYMYLYIVVDLQE